MTPAENDLIQENAALRDKIARQRAEIVEFVMHFEAYRRGWSYIDEDSRLTIERCLKEYEAFGRILKLH